MMWPSPPRDTITALHAAASAVLMHVAQGQGDYTITLPGDSPMCTPIVLAPPRLQPTGLRSSAVVVALGGKEGGGGAVIPIYYCRPDIVEIHCCTHQPTLRSLYSDTCYVTHRTTAAGIAPPLTARPAAYPRVRSAVGRGGSCLPLLVVRPGPRRLLAWVT